MNKVLSTLHSIEFHPLLFLSLIAEPDADNILFELKFFGNLRNFLSRRSRLHSEKCFQRTLLRRRNRGPFPLPVMTAMMIALRIAVDSVERVVDIAKMTHVRVYIVAVGAQQTASTIIGTVIGS